MSLEYKIESKLYLVIHETTGSDQVPLLITLDIVNQSIVKMTSSVHNDKNKKSAPAFTLEFNSSFIDHKKENSSIQSLIFFEETKSTIKSSFDQCDDQFVKEFVFFMKTKESLVPAISLLQFRKSWKTELKPLVRMYMQKEITRSELINQYIEFVQFRLEATIYPEIKIYSKSFSNNSEAKA